MQNIQKFLTEFNHANGILYIAAALLISVEIMKCIAWIAEKFGLKTKYKEKEEKQDLEIMELHDEINEIKCAYNNSVAHCADRDEKIMSALDEIRAQQKANVERSDFISAMSIRRALVDGCEHALREKRITANSLKSLEDLYTAYHDPAYLNQNSYVMDLMEAVKKLEIVVE